MKNNWQTKNQYGELKKTKSKYIIIGNNWERGIQIKSVIGRMGKEIELKENEEWYVINEKYSVFTKNKNIPEKIITLWDNEKFEPIRDIPTNKIYKLYENIGFDISDSENPTHFTTLEGDNFPVPKNYVRGFLNKSTYCFKDEKTYGLAKIDGTELVRLENTSIDYRGKEVFRTRNSVTKKIGLINIEGKILLPTKYDAIYFRNRDIIIAKTSETDEIYNRKGERLFPFPQGGDFYSG